MRCQILEQALVVVGSHNVSLELRPKLGREAVAICDTGGQESPARLVEVCICPASCYEVFANEPVCGDARCQDRVGKDSVRGSQLVVLHSYPCERRWQKQHIKFYILHGDSMNAMEISRLEPWYRDIIQEMPLEP